MATRGQLPIDLIWVLVDLTHNRANQLVTAAEAKHEQMVLGTELSVNRNIAGTQALVKIGTTEAALRDLLPGNVEAAILQVYTKADHAEALALVTTEVWAGPPGQQ